MTVTVAPSSAPSLSWASAPSLSLVGTRSAPSLSWAGTPGLSVVPPRPALSLSWAGTPVIEINGTPIPPPPPPPWTPGITVESRSRQGALLDSLDLAHDLTWQEVLNDTGNGECQLNLTGLGGLPDPSVANVPYRSLLRFSLDGTPRFQSLIEAKSTHMVDKGEENTEIVRVSGRGSLAIFEEAIVYPSGGLGWLPFSDTRVFDFSCPELNEGTWPDTAVVIKQQDNPFQPYGGAPANWPFHAAQWIWGVGGPGPYPVGDCFFKIRFFVPDEVNVRFFVTADDGFDLRLDGGSVISAQPGTNTQAYVWANTQQQDLFLSAGVHVLAIRGTNVARPSSPSTNVAAVLFACYALNPDGSLAPAPADPTGPPQPIIASDGSWKCQAYPNPSPALPLGWVFHSLFDEAKSRGCFGGTVGTGAGAYVDLSFSQTNDTNGNPWPTAEVAFPVGTDLLTVIRQMSTTYNCDFRMRPDSLVLDAFVNLGTTPGVSLLPNQNVSDLSFDGQV